MAISGKGYVGQPWLRGLYPRWESNPYLSFRRAAFYPLNYKGGLSAAAGRLLPRGYVGCPAVRVEGQGARAGRLLLSIGPQR